MKKFTLRTVVFGLAGAVLMSFNSKDQVKPAKATEMIVWGTNPESCEVIEFDEFNKVESANGVVSAIYSDNTPVQVSAQFLSAGGDYESLNAAVLVNTNQPDGRFKTPSAAAARPMGNVLTVGDQKENGVEIRENGSRIELDFSAMGSITLKGIHILDITEDEAGSKLEMLDASGKVIRTMKLPVTGAHGATRLNTGNMPGVVKLRLTFESKNGKGGSGAIDVIEFCRS